EAIEAQAQACAADMDRLNQAHESARGVLEAIGATKPRLNGQLETVRKLGLPTAPYQEGRGALSARAAGAGAGLTPGPLENGTALEALRTRAERLLGRFERVAKLFEEAQQAGASLDDVRRQVANHRAEALKLDEEGGNPDHFLGQGDQAHAQVLVALRAGDP